MGGIVLVLTLARSRRAGAFLRHAAIRWVGLVVGVTGFVAVLAIVLVLAGVRMSRALPVIVLAVLLMVGQFADLMTFAGPEERE